MASISNLLASSSSPLIPGRASSSSTSRGEYDVFLSFFGKDTRKNITDHLYTAMKQKGINVFRDEELKRGKDISQKLSNVIEGSQYAVVIISKNYAFSKWCLMELTKIIECSREKQPSSSKEKRLMIFPLFYHVDPSDVRKQRGSFAKAFVKHRGNPEIDEKQRTTWRAILKEVGNLAGWHVHDRHEAIVVEEICKTILSGLNINKPDIFNDVVGIESQVREMMTLLCIGFRDVRFIGISGMGGVGKTTLARIIYEMFSSKFENRCFIANVSERVKRTAISTLQEQLICGIFKESTIKIWDTYEGMKEIGNRLPHKKVLIVLDNVDKEEQLTALTRSHDWFKQGSRVLITSRDSHLLNKFVDKTYEVQPLSKCDALKLFSLKAFKKDCPEENYMKLSKDIAKYARGLPFALEVFGSFVIGKTMEELKNARDYLKANPNAEILDKLQISFDGLEDLQKELFLDITFVFNGRKYDCNMIDILKSCGYHPTMIDVLKGKSLIKILENEVIWMHDLLIKMGHRIVYRESPREPSKRSRLCCYEDIIKVLKNNTVSIAVEVIVLNLPSHKKEQFNFKALSKMENLRILDISHDDKKNKNFHALECHDCPSQFTLSNDLRVVRWPGYPFGSLPSDFQPYNLFELIMPQSCIKLLWDASKCFEKLTHIDLSNSQYLIEIPNFNTVPNLKKLVLSNCTRLLKVHPSVGFLKRLILLALDGCISLNELPNKISLPSLKYLHACGCSKLNKFPNIADEIPKSVSAMEHLKVFDIGGTAIRQLPCFILASKKLTHLRVGGSPSNPISFMLPNSFSSLSSLESLDLSYCNLLDGALPSDLSCLYTLQFLTLNGNGFTRIPQCVSLLLNLRYLFFDDCSNLQVLIELPPTYSRCLRTQDMNSYNLLDQRNLNYFFSLQSLRLLRVKFTRISDNISQISNLRSLYLSSCRELQALPKLPLDLLTLNLVNCLSLETLGYQLDAWISSEMLVIGDWSFVGVYFGYGSKPYKILYLAPHNPIWTKIKEICIRNTIAWGPTLGSNIPEWFNQRSSSFFGMIQSRIYLDSNKYLMTGFALFIVYEVHGHGDSSSRVVDGNNPNFPRFVCRLQVNECRSRSPFLFRVPEVPKAGLNGVWVFINASCFREVRRDLVTWSYIGASIGTNSKFVEVKECGSRLVCWKDHAEFSNVLSSISSHGFQNKSLVQLDQLMFVQGPIKGSESKKRRS